MGEIEGSRSWTEELASLVEDTGIIYHTTTGDTISPPPPPAFKELKASQFKPEPTESLKDQVKEFAKAWGEIGIEMGRGCRDIVQQTILTEDSVIVQKSSRAKNMVSGKLGFLNEFLPEDRDPIHAWAVVFFVFILALSVGQSSAFTSNYPRRMLPGYGDDGENTEEARAFERCRDLNRAVYTCLNRENSVVPLTDFKEIALYACTITRLHYNFSHLESETISLDGGSISCTYAFRNLQSKIKV